MSIIKKTGICKLFLYYTDITISYGWYSSECYYDRGVAYEKNSIIISAQEKNTRKL